MSPKVTESHKEHRRREILEAAVKVFKKKGYEAASMQDIIEETGMSRGGVYLYFSGKEELFYALLDQNSQDDVLEFEILLKSTGSVWKAVERMLEQQTEYFKSIRDSIAPANYEFHLTGWRETHHSKYILKRYKSSNKALTDFINKGVETGEFKPRLPVAVITKFVISFFDGLGIDTFYVGPENTNVAGQIGALRDFLKDCLQVQMQ